MGELDELESDSDEEDAKKGEASVAPNRPSPSGGTQRPKLGIALFSELQDKGKNLKTRAESDESESDSDEEDARKGEASVAPNRPSPSGGTQKPFAGIGFASALMSNRKNLRNAESDESGSDSDEEDAKKGEASVAPNHPSPSGGTQRKFTCIASALQGTRKVLKNMKTENFESVVEDKLKKSLKVPPDHAC